ncbi:hypothetical protein DFR58_1158 [Anaerobacterium chartisolvens]|uniref:Acyl-CoA:6-aminopenicillanic acid acyl transferase n=1 Tax=Anaerobacterium chartisolvens TaxID=1297424 RepID=A0A369AYX9_9FIRM|nr:C45 family peptidase [Anaerobacterium chartisolvens]RCX14285.1 hypothetical protein DFR58_1158 [Anaerobacterium chartisolvens]
MLKRMLGGIVALVLIFQVGCSKEIAVVTGESSYQEKGVSITDKGNYFDVVLDYTAGLTRRQMGEAFGRAILKAVPNYEALIDSYIAENLSTYEYPYSLLRAEDVMPQMNEDYKEEIEGLADAFSGGKENVRGDNKISRDEIYLFNLFTDVVRGTQCCYLAVSGDRSSTGSTIAGRNLDWFGGQDNQLPIIQSIITMRYTDKKLCSVGYLGYIGILTGFNDDKVFAAIVDSQSGTPYSSLGIRSYALDLRFALESTNTMEDACEFMRDPSKLYGVNHIIGFSDPVKSVILENNFTGDGLDLKRVKRSVRTSESALNKGISWGIDNAVGTVNSFLLYGNHDNHKPNKYNTKRWQNMKRELLEKGEDVTAEELKDVISYKKGKSPGTFSDSGDLYNKMTVQMVVFEPESLSLEVFFRPRNIIDNPEVPVFEKIPVFWQEDGP